MFAGPKVTKGSDFIQLVVLWGIMWWLLGLVTDMEMSENGLQPVPWHDVSNSILQPFVSLLPVMLAFGRFALR